MPLPFNFIHLDEYFFASLFDGDLVELHNDEDWFDYEDDHADEVVGYVHRGDGQSGNPLGILFLLPVSTVSGVTFVDRKAGKRQYVLVDTDNGDAWRQKKEKENLPQLLEMLKTEDGVG